jgi:1,4-dihydroxy-2-naphthoate octaprenyltransferase
VTAVGGAVVELRPPLTPARVWWLASRPATLAASVSPVLVGTACALHAGRPRLVSGLLALVVALAIQVGVNYANDYSDFRRGADTPRRRGPVRAAASGLVPPRHVMWAAIGAFAVAAGAGLVLSLLTDPRLLLAGALAIVAAWLYTGGPRPYGYLGLGEVFVFVFFGLVATCGTTYVEIGFVTPLSVTGAVAMGALACAILVLNNLRDIETDAEAHKRTLAVRIGREATRTLLAALFLLATLMPIAAFALGYAGRWIVEPIITLPLAITVWRLSARDDPKTLVDALKRTAQLEVWFALLWTGGVLMA